MEAEGWPSPIPFALARNVRHMLALYRKRCLQTVLDLWSASMHNLASQTIVALPSLGACMTDQALDEGLALSLRAGKLSIIVKAHNDAHAKLSKYTEGASYMSLSPTLQEHPQTRDVVLVSLHALKLARASVTAIGGLSLLNKVRHERDGPSQVKNFLSKHGADDRALVPKSLWVALEAFAMESDLSSSSAGARPTFSASAGPSGPPKAEDNAQPVAKRHSGGDSTAPDTSTSGVMGLKPRRM